MAFIHSIFGYLNGEGLLIKPQLMLLIFGIGILLTDYFMEPGLKYFNAIMAMAGVIFSGVTLWQINRVIAVSPEHQFGFFNNNQPADPSLIVDHFSIFFGMVFLAATALIILLSVRYMEIEEENHGEFYALMLFATIGMMFMAEGLDLIVQFIGLETMALSF
jgi:NADH-quinone oxidoreductase subunit N